MTTGYSDSRYGVQKVLTFPSVTLSAASATLCQFLVPENIELVEFGLMVTTKISSLSAPTLIIAEGATVLGTLSCPTETAASSLIRTTSLTTTNFNSGDTLVLRHATTATNSGVGTPYLKYKERYVSA